MRATRQHPGVRVDDSISATQPTTLDPLVAEVVGGQRRQLGSRAHGEWVEGGGFTRSGLGVKLVTKLGDSYFATRV